MLIDVIIKKPFGGLSEGMFTQLREHEFEKLSKDGFVAKIDATKADKKESTTESKGTKK